MDLLFTFMFTLRQSKSCFSFGTVPMLHRLVIAFEASMLVKTHFKKDFSLSPLKYFSWRSTKFALIRFFESFWRKIRSFSEITNWAMERSMTASKHFSFFSDTFDECLSESTLFVVVFSSEEMIVQTNERTCARPIELQSLRSELLNVYSKTSFGH